MTVSVCIPTYNSARYIRESIASVLEQTFGDFQLIVCDNGSTDETCEIVRSISDPRLQLHRVETFLGMAGNFNHALSLSRGKYVKFLCYDDLLEPACLEKQVAMLEADPSLSLVTSGLRCVGQDGDILQDVVYCQQEAVLGYAELIAANLVFGNFVGIPSAALIRRERLIQAGPFSERFPQLMDVELYVRLVRLGSVGYTPEPLCRWRLHPNTMTATYRRSGTVRRDQRVLTASMLASVRPSWWARRVAWGRVAGSFLSQAAAGLRHGYCRWPLAAVLQAFCLDPFFLGLGTYMALIRPGRLGLGVDQGGRLFVRRGRTLSDAA
jgi:glycosyltransferase involved in cell wall biosynthesis